jgi:hypothetical protein
MMMLSVSSPRLPGSDDKLKAPLDLDAEEEK